MTPLDTGHLIYLVMLGVAVIFWFFVQNRNSLGKTLQHALSWGLLFLGVIAAFGMWDDIRSTVQPRQSVYEDSQRIEIPRAPDSHYYLTLQVNGQPVRFVVDTGATALVLSQKDAAKIGLDPDNLAYIGRASTANGQVKTAPVILDEIRIGQIRDTRVAASVNQGTMSQSLLGMSYLQRFSQITIAGRKLILIR